MKDIVSERIKSLRIMAALSLRELSRRMEPMEPSFSNPLINMPVKVGEDVERAVEQLILNWKTGIPNAA